jgi:hypothetical protein
LRRYWRYREISDRLASDRNCRKEARNKQLPDAIGFQWETPEPDYDD